MNDIIIKNFHNNKFGDILVILENGVLWFSGCAVAKALGYKGKASNNSISKHVRFCGKKKFNIETNGGLQDLCFLNESGINSLMLKCNTNSTNELANWIYLEIIPNMRRKYIN